MVSPASKSQVKWPRRNIYLIYPGATRDSSVMGGTKLLVSLKCTCLVYLFMFLQIILSFIKIISTRRRFGRMRSQCFFPTRIICRLTAYRFQRRYNRKVYSDFKEELCFRYLSISIPLFPAYTDHRYLKSYHAHGLLNTTRGVNVQQECKRLKNMPRVVAEVSHAVLFVAL